MLDCTCVTIESFVTEVRARSLPVAILAWRAEYGPAATADGTAAYRPVQEVTLLAYDRGTVVRCDLPQAERGAVRAALEAAGVRVEERCRNIAADRPC
jgi:hypothetical protein